MVVEVVNRYVEDALTVFFLFVEIDSEAHCVAARQTVVVAAWHVSNFVEIILWIIIPQNSVGLDKLLVCFGESQQRFARSPSS